MRSDYEKRRLKVHSEVFKDKKDPRLCGLGAGWGTIHPSPIPSLRITSLQRQINGPDYKSLLLIVNVGQSGDSHQCKGWWKMT